MANTYCQLYAQLVFTVKGKKNFIYEKNREELEKYICGIIINKNCKPISIYCNPDHTHILIGIHPAISISDLVRDIKANSSKFINFKNWTASVFRWQDGYGAFSYSRSQIDKVIKYIKNQPIHHNKKTFYEEYITFLNKFEIAFEKKYLFEFYE